MKLQHLPFHEFSLIQLGKYWPECGVEYRVWKSRLLEAFSEKNYIVDVIDAPTYTGGFTLIARAINKKRAHDLESGHACPHCDLVSAEPADTALHLVDRHFWGTDKASAWVREKVEESVFKEVI